MSTVRGLFGSKLGIILATAGSAVGLGNVWRFPYMTGHNGGAAFIIIYIACMLLLGIPGMVCEFIVGRHGATNAARAYDKLSKGKPWKLVGYMGIVTSILILGFYSVVAGWCLNYLFVSFGGSIAADAEGVTNYFLHFSSGVALPIIYGLAFILITHFVVAKGIRQGIERASKMLMPTLFILLLIIVISSCMLPGAYKGIEFLIKPDFSKVTQSMMLEALGQAFFSLSLGTACLCTYASYFGKHIDLMRSACQIAFVDTIVAILAGLMIFPAAFSVGVSPDSGPSLIFITLPNVFSQAFASMPIVGYIISILFYALLSLAALTSTISMHEIGTSFFHEEFNRPRKQAAWVVTVIASVVCIFCSLSVGAYKGLTILGMSIMDFLDYLTAQYLMPCGALLTCLYVGWYISKSVIHQEYTNDGQLRSLSFPLFMFIVRFVCPIFIVLIFLHQFGLI